MGRGSGGRGEGEREREGRYANVMQIASSWDLNIDNKYLVPFKIHGRLLHCYAKAEGEGREGEGVT